jgi:hypothetical protein
MEKISRRRQRIRQLRKVRGLLENRLVKPKGMRVGSVVKQYLFCGKPSCACHRDPQKKHGPYYYLSYKEGGKSRYKYLGKATSPEVERARNYQGFQRGLSEAEGKGAAGGGGGGGMGVFGSFFYFCI